MDLAGSLIPAHRGHEKLREIKMSLRDSLLGAENKRNFWKIAKEIINGREAASLVTADELKRIFEVRMNPLTPTPDTFDASLLRLNGAMAKAIPKRTEDMTEELFFSKPFSEHEVAAAKAHLGDRTNTAKGIDQIRYKEVLEIDNAALCNFLNLCLKAHSAPSSWLSTIIVAILKLRKSKGDPNNYRAVGLESCLLKLMTLLIHM